MSFYSACAARPHEEACMSTDMQEQELAALRAEVAALKRVQRPSAVIRPAQDASQTHIQHLPPPEGGSSQQRSIRDCAPPALGAPDQHATPCRPQGMPLLLAAMPPAQAQVSASGATELSIPSQPVALQPSCANKHTVLGKRDISGGLSSRQESWLQPAADTADELEVRLCVSISDVVCRFVVIANLNVTVQVCDAAPAMS